MLEPIALLGIAGLWQILLGLIKPTSLLMAMLLATSGFFVLAQIATIIDYLIGSTISIGINPNIAGYVNQFFYPIKFNAETKDTIEYNGKIYKPTSPNPKTPHELAIKFLGTSLSYPSTIFVSNNFEYNLLSQGFLEEKKLEPLLIYTVENVYKSASYDDFASQFEHTFYDTVFKKDIVKTYTLKEIEKLQKSRPGVMKKILVKVDIIF